MIPILASIWRTILFNYYLDIGQQMDILILVSFHYLFILFFLTLVDLTLLFSFTSRPNKTRQHSYFRLISCFLFYTQIHFHLSCPLIIIFQ